MNRNAVFSPVHCARIVPIAGAWSGTRVFEAGGSRGNSNCFIAMHDPPDTC